eukprot:scaffold6468_cov175-Skeletonema_marinoi.AAC.2
MKFCIPLVALAWLARFLLVGADSPPPRRLRTTTTMAKKASASSIPLPSHPFGDVDFRNAYRMNQHKYWNKGKHHERQLQNKQTRNRKGKGSRHKFDWKRGRGWESITTRKRTHFVNS